MKVMTGAVGTGLIGLAGLVGCSAGGGAASAAPPATSAAAAPASTAPRASVSPAPAAPKTVIRTQTVPAAPPAATATVTAAPPTAAPAPPPQQPADRNVTDPWAVVSAYYGDIESGDYSQAYALLGSGMTTGQSYQNFAAGFACTGSQVVSRNWESGDQVNFSLVAGDNCNGTTQTYTGTDTVQNGVIVAANVSQTS
jgi:hypothetical protein